MAGLTKLDLKKVTVITKRAAKVKKAKNIDGNITKRKAARLSAKLGIGPIIEASKLEIAEMEAGEDSTPDYNDSLNVDEDVAEEN